MHNEHPFVCIHLVKKGNHLLKKRNRTKMLSVRKQDPLFVNFVPKTAEQAVDRFTRCKRRGLKPYLVPECLIACAQGLSPEEMEKFENWIVDPEGNTDMEMQLVETKALQQMNQQVFDENVQRVEAKMTECSLDQDDEKMPDAPDQDDEKMSDVIPEMPTLTLQQSC